METAQMTIISLIKEATGISDVPSIDFKNIDNIEKDQINFKKVRGSVRFMSGKVKTRKDAESMKQKFIALHLP